MLFAVDGRLFLSTPSARRATIQTGIQYNAQLISIHALREEGDHQSQKQVGQRCNFYPRPPRGGRPFITASSKTRQYFYPRPPRGGRPCSGSTGRSLWVFLSTPSARRATSIPLVVVRRYVYFYPRPPRGGRPDVTIEEQGKIKISIHALREEGDPISIPLTGPAKVFLSTPSARRATEKLDEIYHALHDISIHALREEGDYALLSCL